MTMYRTQSRFRASLNRAAFPQPEFSARGITNRVLELASKRYASASLLKLSEASLDAPGCDAADFLDAPEHGRLGRAASAAA